MNAQDRDVGADDGLADEGRQHRGIVTDVTFVPRHIGLADDCGDTLNDVVFTLGGSWVNQRGLDDAVVTRRRTVAAF